MLNKLKLKFMVKNNRGFTLIETMIVVALIAILAGLAAPSFLESMNKRRLTQATEALFNDVVYARAEAIKQNDQVIFQLEATSLTAWCYGLDDDDSTVCDCAVTPANCTINGVQKSLGQFTKKQKAIAVRKAAEVMYGYHPNHGK